MKIKQYVMVVNGDPNRMAKEVQDSIETGWQPYGSPMAVSQTDDYIWHYQALVKYEDAPAQEKAIGVVEQNT
jgi:hypothetical protein